MTTVATDGRSMAAHGMITDNDIVSTRDCMKIRRLTDGRIVGFAGNAYNYDAFAEWLEKGGDLPKVDAQFECLVLNPDGSVVTFDEFGRSFRENGVWAIGSGQRFALAAMDMGKTAADAVSYAATRDIFTGGVIAALYLQTDLKAAA